MRWFKKVWEDPVGSTIIAAGILSILGCVGNYLSNGWVLSVLKSVWSFIVFCLTYKIPVYWILIIVFAIMGTFILVLWCASKRGANTIKEELPYVEYTEDTFDGIPYRWGYIQGRIANLQELCPKCETPLVYNKCPKCNSYIPYRSNKKTEQEIMVLIADNIRRKYYTSN